MNIVSSSKSLHFEDQNQTHIAIDLASKICNNLKTNI